MEANNESQKAGFTEIWPGLKLLTHVNSQR